MRNRISALFIDPQHNEHDYTLIRTDKPFDTYEDGFEIKVLDSSINILEELNNFKGFDALVTIGEDINFEPLNFLPFEFRKKWIHYEDFNPESIVDGIIATFKLNINRERVDSVKLFSIFTCTYNTKKEEFYRLYNSLLRQSYPNWNWWIIDDSTNTDVQTYIDELKDPRITMIKNHTNHGNIGFNKHMIAMCCDGDYLVEVDHDDELLPDCLEQLRRAFIKYPDSDFVYSEALEDVDGKDMYYGDEYDFSCCYGYYKYEDVKGVSRKIAVTPNINQNTIRLITGQPNHVRCWKKNFYHRIGGHNSELPVLDDQDILIRTFLYGKMCRVDKVLYIQYEHGERNSTGRNTQSKRFNEIQRTMWLLKDKYDQQIHDRIIELGYKDEIWNDEYRFSDIHMKPEEEQVFNYTYIPE